MKAFTLFGTFAMLSFGCGLAYADAADRRGNFQTVSKPHQDHDCWGADDTPLARPPSNCVPLPKPDLH